MRDGPSAEGVVIWGFSPFAMISSLRSLISKSLLLALPWVAATALPDPPPYDPAIEAGLKSWRTAGGKFNAACSSCHAPDAFDLAVFDFKDHHIRRRAMTHVGQDDADRIVALIHAIRKKYKITKPLEPMAVRPFQPGGELLPGATSEQRDFELGKSLKRLAPTLSVGRIETLADARRAKNELLAVDLEKLRIGIPFNRWSEDKFHGDSHGLLADWVPDVPRAPKSESSAEWFKLLDVYIEDPSANNLAPILKESGNLTKNFTEMPFSELSLAKYKSLLIGQHRLRAHFIPDGSTEIDLNGTNPMWDVGHYAAINDQFDYESQGMPDEVYPLLSSKVNAPNQLKEMRAAWLWLGWIHDPGLQRSSSDPTTKNARYFSLALWRDGGYAIHNAFMIARKQLSQSFDAAAQPDGSTPKFVMDYSEFALHGNWKQCQPKEKEHLKLFQTIASNAYRMSLHLLIDDIGRTNTVVNKRLVGFQLAAMEEFLAASDPDFRKEDAALISRARQSVDKATE